MTNSKIINPEVLLFGYKNGIFPMADHETKEIKWYEPTRRAIFLLNDFKIPRSLKSLLKKNIFKVTFNQSFENVIRFCANRKETWISEEIIQSYINLFKIGYAHSVETWKNGEIVGGLYGVSLGGIFYGESMFSKISGASKIAFAELVNKLQKQNFDFIDAQFMNDHLKMLGAIEISKQKFKSYLKLSINKNCKFI